MFTYIQCGCVSVNVCVCTFMYCYVQFVPIWKCGISVRCTLWFICFAPAASVLPQSLSFSLYLWIFHSSLVFPCPCFMWIRLNTVFLSILFLFIAVLSTPLMNANCDSFRLFSFIGSWMSLSLLSSFFLDVQNSLIRISIYRTQYALKIL